MSRKALIKQIQLIFEVHVVFTTREIKAFMLMRRMNAVITLALTAAGIVSTLR